MKNSKATPRRSDRQTSKREAVPMVTVQNVNVPGYTSRVNAAKYTAMRWALLRVRHGLRDDTGGDVQK